MPEITFIEPDGSSRSVTAQEGQTALTVAMDNGINGILGDCGGNCACATCQGYMEGPAAASLAPPSEDETMMLDGALHLQENSRLCCQIRVTDALNGLVIRMPPSQI